MRLKNSLEEALCILLILAMTKEGKPLKSASISQQLGVSDSYTKKVLRKLVIGEVILSSVSKGGGFSLAKPLDKIFILDVIHAIEGRESLIRCQHLTSRVFACQSEAQRVEENFIHFFREGEAVLYQHFANYSVGDLLKVRNEADKTAVR